MGKLVGFDIGESSVKLVYFNGSELKKAVTLPLPDAMVSGGRILSMDAMADFLKEGAKEQGIPRAGAAMVLPAAEVFTRDVTVPAMTEQQLRYNLPYEFHDFLTEEKSKYFFDYSVENIRRNEEGQPEEMELFACAMLKEAVERYRAMFRRAGFRLKVLTPPECAYGGLLAAYQARTGGEEADRCIVDLGHTSTHLYIFQGSHFDSRREIELGIADLDEKIAETFGVDVHVAHSYTLTNYNDVLTAEYAVEFYNRLAVEILKAINFYHYNNRDRALREVCLCGGGYSIEPLRAAVEETTRLAVRPPEELLGDHMHTEEPWRYLRAIGCVDEGLRGGLK